MSDKNLPFRHAVLLERKARDARNTVPWPKGSVKGGPRRPRRKRWTVTESVRRQHL